MPEPAATPQPDPRFRHLATLLRLISPGRDLPGEMPGTDDWPSIEHLAHIYHVAPMLWDRIRCADSVSLLKDDLATRLRQAYTANARRNRLLRSAIIRLTRRLNGAGLTPMLLKGAVYLVDPLSGNPATRYMHDLDILVQEGEGDACYRALLSSGFNPPLQEVVLEPRHHHLPVLVDPHLGVEVEIHTRPLLDCPDGLSRLYFEQAIASRLEGTQLLLPPRSLRIVHNIVHSQLIDLGLLLGRLNPRSLLEFCEHCVFYDVDDWTRALLLLRPHRRALGSWVHISRSLMATSPPVPCGPGLLDRLHLARIRIHGGDPMVYTLLSRILAKAALTLRVHRRAGS